MSVQIKIDDALFVIDASKWLMCDIDNGDSCLALNPEEAKQLLKFLQENL